MGAFYAFIRAIMIVLIKTIFPCKVYGKENLPEERGYLLASNHTSMSDVIYLIATNKRQINFMGKAELFKTKIMAFLYRKMGCFPVERGNNDKGAIKFAEMLGEQNKVVGIFPEGTRNKEFGPPKKGKAGAVVIASSAKVPIVPCAIYREGKFMIFRKTVVRYGKPIECNELPNVEDGQTALREGVTRLMDSIPELWRLGK